MEFEVNAEWVMDSEINDDVLFRIDQAWDEADESFCSSSSRTRRDAVDLSFVIEAADASTALTRGREAIDATLKRLPMPVQRLLAVEKRSTPLSMGWACAARLVTCR